MGRATWLRSRFWVWPREALGRNRWGTRAAGRTFTSCLSGNGKKKYLHVMSFKAPLSRDSAPRHMLIKLLSTKCSVCYSWSRTISHTKTQTHSNFASSHPPPVFLIFPPSFLLPWTLFLHILHLTFCPLTLSASIPRRHLLQLPLKTLREGQATFALSQYSLIP